MVDPRAGRFSQGFAAGGNLVQGKFEQEQAAIKQQQDQQNLLREQAITGVDESLKTIGTSAKEMSGKYYTSKGLNDQKGMDEAIAAQEMLVKTLWESTEPALRAVGLDENQINIAKERFRIGARLNNPAAEQKLIAAGEAEGRLQSQQTLEGQKQDAVQKQFLNSLDETVTQTKDGQFIDTQGKVITDVSRLNNLRNMPTTNTEIQMTQGGAASQPPGQEPFEGIGVSIMEDIRQSSGAFAAASKAVSRTVGQAVEGTNPRLDAEQRVRNFNQDFKNTLTRNPKYPVAELKAISANLLPDPSAIMTDPEAEARKIPLLKQHLENLNEVDARTLQGNLSKKGRNDTIDRMASRQSGIDLIGDVPDISASTEAEIDSLQEKVLADTATEEELNRFIELSK